ncbi:MAG: hypothetical protein KatS3mg087_1096 [Patescibacteria group bacterium]|nr:MAG: hypothetical protein KatS3mg087_1096 [Patescibacteria group bacterium]
MAERHTESKLVQLLEKSKAKKHRNWISTRIKNELISRNLWAIEASITKLANLLGLTQQQRDDLLSEAYLALMAALDRYESSYKAKLSTYIFACVQRSMKMHLYQEHKKSEREILIESIQWFDQANDSFKKHDSWTPEDKEYIRTKLRRILSALPPKQRYVIVHSVGINCESQTLEEIGKAIGVTKERARQIRKEGLAMLRLLAERGKLDDYLD